MHKIATYLVKSAKKLSHLFPTRLPEGATGFNKLFSDLVYTYNFPQENSYRQAVATMIMHMGQTQDRAPKRFFAKSIRKSMANQTAFHVIEECRQKDKEEKHKREAASLHVEGPDCPTNTPN